MLIIGSKCAFRNSGRHENIQQVRPSEIFRVVTVLNETHCIPPHERITDVGSVQ